MTRDELTRTANQLGTSDARSALMSEIVQSFDQSDTDGDGKVSFQEAMAFQQSSGTASNAVSTASTDSGFGSASSSSSNGNSEARVMMQIMKLMQAYSIGNDPSQDPGRLSSLSVSA